MSPTVQTSYGMLQGTEEGGVSVFRGVPYARPPVGSLRFRAPERPERWQGVRDATRFGPGSYQGDRPLAPLLGIVVPEQSEDCLYLNIWSPGVNDGRRRPVFVWIHGGAFVIGAGSEVTYDGAELARRGDVVVVTINYRLGVFGFLRGRDLCGEALPSTGNEGLLDAVAALTWVRDEIAAFGGDPDNVTLAGESAGSMASACLMTMPQAKGLFHRAVLESGSLNLLAPAAGASKLAELVLEELGQTPGDADRLYELPAPELLAAQDRVSKRWQGLAAFGPCADGDVVPARPFAAIAGGSSHGVPLLIGTNLEEMKLCRFLDPTIDALDEEGLVRRCEAIFPGTGPDSAPNARRAVETYRTARAARGEEVTPAAIWLAVATDQVFRAGATKLAELHAAHTPQTYTYLFGWKATVPGGPQGAIHGLELPFVFGTLKTSKIATFFEVGPAAETLSRQMQDAWVAFMRTGSPRTESLPEWAPYAPPRRATMLLDSRPRLVDAPMEAERALWV